MPDPATQLAILRATLARTPHTPQRPKSDAEIDHDSRMEQRAEEAKYDREHPTSERDADALAWGRS